MPSLIDTYNPTKPTFEQKIEMVNTFTDDHRGGEISIIDLMDEDSHFIVHELKELFGDDIFDGVETRYWLLGLADGIADPVTEENIDDIVRRMIADEDAYIMTMQEFYAMHFDMEEFKRALEKQSARWNGAIDFVAFGKAMGWF